MLRTGKLATELIYHEALCLEGKFFTGLPLRLMSCCCKIEREYSSQYYSLKEISLMRKIYLVTVLAILIQSCSGMPVLFPTITPAPTATETLTATPSSTPTITTTPTITPSPTIVHIPTYDPYQPTMTAISFPTRAGATPVAPFSTPTSNRPGPGFVAVTISDKKIYWGSCKPNATKIIAKMENPEDVYSIIVFVQVKSAFKEDSTPWTSGDVMERHVDGTFSYLLSANTTRGHNHYKQSWILFQLVATNGFGEVIGRTKIYSSEIALSPCM
jgi:hypothetical protein